MVDKRIKIFYWAVIATIYFIAFSNEYSSFEGLSKWTLIYLASAFLMGPFFWKGNLYVPIRIEPLTSKDSFVYRCIALFLYGVIMFGTIVLN